MAQSGVGRTRSPWGNGPGACREPHAPQAWPWGRAVTASACRPVTSHLTLCSLRKPRAELALADARLVFLWVADSPRLCSHDVPFHEAVACSERLFAMPNAAPIPFYDL